MDFESIRRCWREDAPLSSLTLEEAPVTALLRNRATDVRRDVRRRLRREAGYYIPMMAIVAASLLGGTGLTRILAVTGAVTAFAGIVLTLWWAERHLADAPLDRSLRDALTALGANIDAAGRAYVAAYVAVVGLTAIAAVSVVAWRYGLGLRFAAAAGVGVVAIAWSVGSGRAYVDRMFKRERIQLASGLRELNEQI